MKLVYSLLFLWLTVILAVPLVLQAAGLCDNPKSVVESIDCVKTKIATPGKLVVDQTETGLLTKIINWLLSLVAILALLALIIGGVMYIMSFGNEELAKRAKRVILYAIIGLLVVFLSFAVLLAVQNFFKK